MNTTPSIEEIVEELSVICEQADRYQTDNGYTVDVPSKVLLRAKLTTLLTSKENEILERLENVKRVERWAVSAFPVVDEKNIAYNNALEDAQTIIKYVMKG